MPSTKVLLLLVPFSIAACTTTSERSAKIQVYEQPVSILDKCQKLGPVNISVGILSRTPDLETELRARLREETAKLGGDSVVVLRTDTLPKEFRMQGIAYKCF